MAAVQRSLYAGMAAGDATIASPTISYQWQAGPVGGPYTNLVESAKYVGTQTTNLVVNTLVAGDAAPVYLLAATNGGGTTLSRPAAVNVIIFAAVTPGSYEAYALSNSPAGFWPLNETGDPTTGYLLALDYSGNNLNGTYGVTSETWINGIFSPQPPAFGGFDANQGALLVAGAGNVSSVVTLPLLNLPAFVTNRSFAMWINPNTQPHTYAALLFNRGGSDGAAGFGFNGSQGNDINGNPSTALGYTWNNNNGNTYNWNSTLRPPIGQWSFVSLVVNPSNAIVYLYFQDNNGVYHLQSATNNVAPEFGGYFSGGTIQIGGDTVGNANNVFAGSISEVGIYTSSLSAAQLTQMYIAGLGVGGAPGADHRPAAERSHLRGFPVNLQRHCRRHCAHFLSVAVQQCQFDERRRFLRRHQQHPDHQQCVGAYVGTYDLVVSNLFGAAVTSSNATLGILSPAVVGQWLNGTTNLNDTSGYSPTNTHDLYTVGVGNFMFTNDVPPNQPTNGVSMWLYNGDTGLSVSNSSTLNPATPTRLTIPSRRTSPSASGRAASRAVGIRGCPSMVRTRRNPAGSFAKTAAPASPMRV